MNPLRPGPRWPLAAVPTSGAEPPRHLCVVLHDVAPPQWDRCIRVLRQVQTVARQAGTVLPVTLLVVPRMHGVDGSSAHYLRWLQRMAHTGHELALHGLTHLDDGPPPRTLHERLMRRGYTDGEAEFAALPEAQARQRLAAGMAWAQAHELPMSGFVPPAWMLNDAGWRAVGAAGFDYTCTLSRVVALPQRQGLPAPCLVFSTRSAWRRGLSVLWNRALAWQAREAPLLRLELHPDDGDHRAVRRCWSGLLARALHERRPLRLGEAAALARQAGTPPAMGPA